jgi:hypothetical protein
MAGDNLTRDLGGKDPLAPRALYSFILVPMFFLLILHESGPPWLLLCVRPQTLNSQPQTLNLKP